MRFTSDELETCLRVLQEVADDPSVMDEHERFKGLVAKVHRQGRKGQRKRVRETDRRTDRHLAEQTARVAGLSNPPALLTSVGEDIPEYRRPKTCYVCKAAFIRVHPFYHQLCPSCAESNQRKRDQRADLRGRRALLTGGRIKIGQQIGLRLLRDGADLIVTTRFPTDARRRYEAEPDADSWLDRLHVVGLDLRDLPAVEAFATDLLDRLPALDVLINNAAQTIRRPLAFYAHLLADETPALLEARAVSNRPVLAEQRWFPPGQLDAHGQQIDLRPVNSWSLRLHEVGTLEMLEVQLVNVVAPFLLASRLKLLFLRSTFSRRFIVNVSAREGQFGRATRMATHPHTNMAKAALNMLTRTSAIDYATDGIYMTSVDPGWFSDQKPHPASARARSEGFVTPLDCIDAMARVYDPIARGLNEPGEPFFGVYLKDYAPYPW